jgi:hypothetical protein
MFSDSPFDTDRMVLDDPADPSRAGTALACQLDDREGVTQPMSALPKDLEMALDDMLDSVHIDEDDLEEEVETAQRAIAW